MSLLLPALLSEPLELELLSCLEHGALLSPLLPQAGLQLAQRRLLLLLQVGLGELQLRRVQVGQAQTESLHLQTVLRLSTNTNQGVPVKQVKRLNNHFNKSDK